MTEPSCFLCVHFTHPSAPKETLELVCTVHSRKSPETSQYHLYRCASCNLYFVHPKLKDYRSFYNENYYHWYVKYEKERMDDVVMALDHLHGIVGEKRGKLLDVGCGIGYFLHEAQKHGWKAEGLEISSYAADYLKRQNVKVFHGTVEEYAGNETFDVITLWGVIAHLPDPMADLRKLHDLLKPDGILALLTPNAQWLHFQYQIWRTKKDHFNRLYIPTHIYHHTKKSLTHLLKTCNYEMISAFNEKEEAMSSVRTEKQFLSYLFHKTLYRLSELQGEKEILMAFAKKSTG